MPQLIIFLVVLTIVVNVALATIGAIRGCVRDTWQECRDAWNARVERRVQAEQETERKAQELAQKREAARQASSRDAELRSFTLKEAPILWTTYQNLQAEIENQNKKIADLRKSLEAFGHDPDSDADFKRVCSMRDEMIGSLRTMRTKIEDAYLASLKYEATPGKKEYGDLMRKALEDGVQEADAASAKYKNLSQTK